MHYLTCLLFISGLSIFTTQAASDNVNATSLGLGPRTKVPQGHIESSVYGWHLQFTAVRGRPMPWWSIYGCVADGIGAARELDRREHPSDPWLCESRNVKVEAKPLGGGDLDLSLLSDGFELLSLVMDDYQVPNADFQIFDYNVPKIRCSLVWAPIGVDGQGPQSVGVDVA